MLAWWKPPQLSTCFVMSSGTEKPCQYQLDYTSFALLPYQCFCMVARCGLWQRLSSGDSEPSTIVTCQQSSASILETVCQMTNCYTSQDSRLSLTSWEGTDFDGSAMLIAWTTPTEVPLWSRRQDMITDDLAQADIKNCRWQTMDHDHGRALINKKTQVKAPAANLAEIVKQFNQRADDRRATAALPPPPPPPRAIELLPKNADFMPQGITKRVKSCAKQWCKANRILMTWDTYPSPRSMRPLFAF